MGNWNKITVMRMNHILEQNRLSRSAIWMALMTITLLLSAVQPVMGDETPSVGDHIEFGTYPQTTEGTDDTAIEWQVLAVDGESALLLSCYGLDVQPFNETDDPSASWETCTLRQWLNGDFLSCAFSTDEQSAILLTNVPNGADQGYSEWNTTGSNDTQDKVFVLSYAEASEYLHVGPTALDGVNLDGCVAPTAYALSQGADISDETKNAEGEYTACWWLRSPSGLRRYGGAVVYVTGGLSRTNVDRTSYCVRPSVWVDLGSEAF